MGVACVTGVHVSASMPWRPCRGAVCADQPCVPQREGCRVTMMRTFYALDDEPFSPMVHPAWFFASRSHTAALQALLESLQARQALALLLGEPGVGKTFLVHAALAHSLPQHLTLVHLWYPPGSFHET